jgi:heptosyltransferase-2
MTPTQGRILVIRGGAIGDFILTLPVFAALRKQLPAARLEVLGYPNVTQLAQAGGLVDDVRHIEARPLAGFFARHGTLDASLQDYFASFALIISYLYDPDEIFETNVRRCSRAQFIRGSHRPEETQNLHASESLLKPLERLAIFEANPVPGLSVPRSNSIRPLSSGSRSLALHPGSGSERKNWPERHWMGLVERLLRETQHKLLLVGGEAEGDRLIHLAARGDGNRIELAQGLPLVKLASRLLESDFFLGHDSGISHLAAALGLPGLVLWGPTNPAVWRPQSDLFELISSPGGLEEISTDDVFFRIRLRLGE